MSEFWIAAISVVISILGSISILSFAFGKKVNQLDTVSADVKDLKSTVKEILDKIGQLSLDVAVLQATNKSCKINENTLAVQHSPLMLTDEGREMSKLIKADQLFNAHKAELYALLDENKLKNAYDIQGETFLTVQRNFYSMLSEQELKELKDVAYAKGDMIENYLVIFQIMLRDDVLESKGIHVKDIDTFSSIVPPVK